MTEHPPSVGTDHCRVTEPDEASDAGSLFEYYRHLFPYTEVARRIRPDARVLEVGCGAGYGANHLATAAPDVIATDASAQAVRYARARYPAVRFEQASSTELPFTDATFDDVVSFQVIEHVAEDHQYVGELLRVVKPGGGLYLTTPNRRLRLLPGQRPWNPYHVREYSDRSLHSLLRSHVPNALVQGIMSRPDLMVAERARVRQRPAAVLARLVYERLQPLLPRSARRRLRERNAKGRKDPAVGVSSESPVALDDFFLSRETRACLDLFSIVTKP